MQVDRGLQVLTKSCAKSQKQQWILMNNPLVSERLSFDGANAEIPIKQQNYTWAISSNSACIHHTIVVVLGLYFILGVQMKGRGL